MLATADDAATGGAAGNDAAAGDAASKDAALKDPALKDAALKDAAAESGAGENILVDESGYLVACPAQAPFRSFQREDGLSGHELGEPQRMRRIRAGGPPPTFA